MKYYLALPFSSKNLKPANGRAWASRADNWDTGHPHRFRWDGIELRSEFTSSEIFSICKYYSWTIDRDILAIGIVEPVLEIYEPTKRAIKI